MVDFNKREFICEQDYLYLLYKLGVISYETEQFANETGDYSCIPDSIEIKAEVAKVDKPDIEISKVLCLSTAHISQQTADELIWNRHAINHVIYPKENNYGESYGWFVLTCDLEDEQCNIPDDLWETMKFAEENGCDWLNLDVDGPIVDGLKTYEWS